ncbi:hypothetical protein FRC18_009812 [Serendipita sp. 400]|nr:hypothetical protein FRC18_009812 [Serendipita sp. 400]
MSFSTVSSLSPVDSVSLPAPTWVVALRSGELTPSLQQKISLSMLLAHIKAVDQRDAFEGFIFNSPAPSIASSRSSLDWGWNRRSSSNIIVVDESDDDDDDDDDGYCRRLSALTASSIGSFTRRGSGTKKPPVAPDPAISKSTKAERRKGCLIDGNKRSLRQKIKQTLDILSKKSTSPDSSRKSSLASIGASLVSPKVPPRLPPKGSSLPSCWFDDEDDPGLEERGFWSSSTLVEDVTDSINPSKRKYDTPLDPQFSFSRRCAPSSDELADPLCKL